MKGISWQYTKTAPSLWIHSMGFNPTTKLWVTAKLQIISVLSHMTNDILTNPREEGKVRYGSVVGTYLSFVGEDLLTVIL